ncbi:ABC transporter ATP-binding protein [Cellulosimicrobium cellulans]|uniref:ABC transporter ATP-binding protein n=1 Tax=Cellulosimicrobium cellulans TaxID=1710 RepID=UPI00130DE73A|nr:ABC transporter ATP-binding protein [Cellulosimicrobium cellulans]
MDHVLVAEDLVKTYGSGQASVSALGGVSLRVARGEFVAVVGTSGSGKSTLLHMLGGLDRPTSGTVRVAGVDLSGLSVDELAVLRRRSIGFVFQAYNLLPMLTVRENVVLPTELDGRRIDEDFVQGIFAGLGLADRQAAMPGHLSGGQQQRVAVARALAAKPEVLLADEPTGNLDTRSGQDVLGAITTGARRFGQTVVLITHDHEIAQLADRIVRIEDGRIVTPRAAA